MPSIDILQPNWPAPANIIAGTTLRAGGFSQGDGYASFNLADHVGDHPDHVAANRQRLTQHFHWQNEPTWLCQQHSAKVIELNDGTLSNVQADASYTRSTGQTCLVLTADCLPILICNQAGTEIAAIHAGWRGLAAGIINNTCSALQSKPEQLYVWLGPAIGADAYIVGHDLYQNFCQKDSVFTAAFSSTGTADRYHADLYQIARSQLFKFGIDREQIYGGSWCTAQQADLFFSYRRDGAQSGRMASFIHKVQ